MYHMDYGYEFSYDFFKDYFKLEKQKANVHVQGIVYEHQVFLDNYDGIFGIARESFGDSIGMDLAKELSLENVFSLYMHSGTSSRLYYGGYETSKI